ncbi:MAG: GNAT family N-acetyltransferase, partial [Promethearchaeota archaeon]
MGENFHIRKATTSDIPTFVTLWKELMIIHGKIDPLFEMSSDAEINYQKGIKSAIENKSEDAITINFVAIDKKSQSVVGYLSGYIGSRFPIYKRLKFGMILGIYVNKTYRNRHIGTHLVEKAKKWFGKRDITHLQIEVAKGNPIGLPF